MAEDEDKIELRPGSKKSDKKSDKKPTKKNKKKPSLNFKNKNLLVPVLAIFAVLFLASAIFLTYNFVFNKDDASGELTYAEDIEQYKLQEGADQDAHNTNNLRVAWAYYNESNYDRALGLLESVKDPAREIMNSYNELYGLVLSALGRDEEAQSYNQATLEEYEGPLLNAVDEDPTAYYNLGLLNANAGNTEEAVKYYQKFIDVYKDAPEYITDTPEYELVELAEQAIEELQ